MNGTTEEFRIGQDWPMDLINIENFYRLKISWTMSLGFATLTYILYFIFIRKLNIIRDLTDTGFTYLKDGTHRTVEHKLRSRKQLAKTATRRRLIGDIPPIYPNGWFALLEISDLRKENVQYVSALGEHFAVVRTASGDIRVLDAYCPHLGANMAVGGRVHGDCLECPFHKWRFSTDTGACTTVPYSSSIPAVKVKRWPSMVANDFLFVWYHAEGAEPTWFVNQNPSLKSGEWTYHGRTDIIVGCHIQDIPENGADIGHLNALHGGSLLGGTDVRHCEKDPYQFMRHVWTAQWDPCLAEPHKAIIALTHETRIFGKYLLSRVDASIEQIGPGYVELLLQSAWGPMLLIQTVTPVQALQQRVVHRIYSPFLSGPMTRLALFLETIMFQRDVMVWNLKKYESKPHLVKEDRGILRHRRWYNQFYSENSPRFSYQKDTLEW